MNLPIFYFDYLEGTLYLTMSLLLDKSGTVYNISAIVRSPSCGLAGNETTPR